jgi:hypothetical protein
MIEKRVIRMIYEDLSYSVNTILEKTLRKTYHQKVVRNDVLRKVNGIRFIT